MKRMTTALLVLATTAVGATARQQMPQPPRDAAPATRSARAGSASISGLVIDDGPQQLPLRRAVVTVSDTLSAETRTVATDDAGRFVFRELPSGRYLVSAAKAAYVTTAYGATRPSRVNAAPVGTAINIAERQEVADVIIRLARGAVLSGTIREAGGRPAIATRVTAGYYGRLPNGERMFLAASGAITDDQGAYRIFGLAPGDYVIYVAAPVLAPSGEVEVTTAADVQRARRALDGQPVPAATGAASRPETAWFTATYYPGQSTLSDATILRVAAGEERDGLDLLLRMMPTAHVGGVVIDESGQPARNVTVELLTRLSPSTLQATVITDAQGRFRFIGVPPAACAIVARVSQVDAVTGQGVDVFGLVEVEVRGVDITTEVHLLRGASIAGRATLEAPAPATSHVSLARVTLTPTSLNVARAPRVLSIGDDGRFDVRGLAPGTYRLSVAAQPGASLTSISLKAAIVEGQDALDTPFTVAPGQSISGAQLTLTTATTLVTGRLMDTAGAPAPEYFVIAFSADRRHWIPMSRRIQHARPALDGTFTFRNLPPGDYLIGAAIDIEQGEWFDPDFLAGLAATGVARVALAEGQRLVQDLRVTLR